MITIKFSYQDDELVGIESEGHSRYTHVCTAVSVLMQTLILGLNEIVQIEELKYEVDNKNSRIKVLLPLKNSETFLLVHTISEALKQISKQYPKQCHINSFVICYKK